MARDGISGEVDEIYGIESPGNGVVMVSGKYDGGFVPYHGDGLVRFRSIPDNIAKADDPFGTASACVLQYRRQGDYVCMDI